MESYQKYEPQKDNLHHKVGKDIYGLLQKNGLFKISNKNLELVKGTENFNTKKKDCIYK